MKQTQREQNITEILTQEIVAVRVASFEINQSNSVFFLIMETISVLHCVFEFPGLLLNNDLLTSGAERISLA